VRSVIVGQDDTGIWLVLTDPTCQFDTIHVATQVYIGEQDVHHAAGQHSDCLVCIGSLKDFKSATPQKSCHSLALEYIALHNIAARLEAEAPPDGTIPSRAVREAVDGRLKAKLGALRELTTQEH
jgi:hypothetical protein